MFSLNYRFISLWSLVWLFYLLCLGSCYYFMQLYPAQIVAGLISQAGVVLYGLALLALWQVLAHDNWRQRWPVTFNYRRIALGLLLAIFSLTITTVAIAKLPPPLITQASLALLNLNFFYRLIFGLMLIYFSLITLGQSWQISMAEAGIVTIVTYGALNGRFFNLLVMPQTLLLYGLTLTTYLAYLLEPEPFPPPARLKNPLTWPVLLFVLGGIITTVYAFYPYRSWILWLNLTNWVGLFFLLVLTIRRPEQIQRLLVALLLMAGLVGLSGLSSLFYTIPQVGWSRAIWLRYNLGYMFANGAGVYAAIYVMISLGLMRIWPARWLRTGLGILVGVLLLCLGLTYSRSAATGFLAGLICLIGLNLNYSRLTGRKWALHLNRRRGLAGGGLLVLAITFIILGFVSRNISGTWSSRLLIWRLALEVISRHFWIGTGVDGNFSPFFLNSLSLDEINWVRTFMVGSHAHNLFLQVGMAMGLGGLLLLGWILTAAARFTWQAIKQPGQPPELRTLLTALGAALVVWVTAHLMAMVLSEQSLLAETFWILLGLLLVIGQGSVLTTPVSGAPRPLRLSRSILAVGAITALTLLLVARPVAAELFRGRARIAQAAGELAAAQSALKWAGRLDPLDAEIPARLAQLETDPAMAGSFYQQAIALRPAHAPYQAKLGWLYWRQNQPELALTAFQQAVALDKYGLTGGPYQAYLGYLFTAMGQPQAARAALQEALQIKPDFVQAPDWQNVSGDDIILAPAYTRYAATKQPDPALKQLIDYHLGQRSLSAGFEGSGSPEFYLKDTLRPPFSDLKAAMPATSQPPDSFRLTLAKIYLDWQLFQPAQTCLALAQESNPNLSRQFDFLELRSRAWAGQQQWPQAQADLEAALLIRANTAALHYRLAAVYRQQGRLAQAAAEYDRMTALWDPKYPLNPAWWFEAGQLFQQVGRINQAVDAYRMAQFLTHSPEDYRLYQQFLAAALAGEPAARP